MAIAGDYIEKAKKAGYSNYKLCQSSGVDQRKMAEIKRGQRPMPQALIETVASVLDIDPVQIELDLIAEKRSGKHAKRLKDTAKKWTALRKAACASGDYILC